MVTGSPTRSRKILLAIVAMLLMAAAALLLIGCPSTKTAVNQATTASPSTAAPAKLLDSTALINRLASLTTSAMAGRESATPGGLLAQQYVVRQFDSLQIAKAG